MFLRLTNSIIIISSIFAILSCNNKNSLKESSEIEIGPLILTSRACYFADADSIEKHTQIKIDTASCREIEQITSIMEYVGLPQNFKIYRGDIDNALATVVNNQRVIIYNKDLFSTMDEMNSSYWTSLFIIAHEIGHHLANNISDTSNALSAELDADKFAGFLLNRMGADSNQVVAAVASNLISTSIDSKTHPAKEKRIETVKKSWMESYNLRYFSATPPPIVSSGGLVEQWLIFNKFFLYKWGLKRLDIYSDNDIASDDFQHGLDYYHIFDDSQSYDDPKSYLSHLPSDKIRLKGIITDVLKMPDDPELPGVSSISVMVNLTQLDTFVYDGMKLNHRSNFFIYFEPLTKKDDVRDFYKFFVGGRRIDFTAFQLGNTSDSNIKMNYIAKAVAY